MQSIGAFLNLLTHVKAAGDNQWVSDCPCPTHKTPAKHLSIALKDNKILVTCFGSDSAEDIVTALNLTLSDLFLEDKASPIQTIAPAKIVKEYIYQDESGNELFQCVRYEPKDFKQRHKNGKGEYVWNLDGVRRVLYHLPDILIPGSETVYLVEGEKDADNLWAWGQVATTSPMGAGAWRDEYANYLTGKRVCIIPDKDNAGMSYARQAANSLADKADNLQVILLPDGFKDISDWLAVGNDVAELPLMQQAIEALFASDKPIYRQDEASIRWDKKVGDNLLLTFKAEKISEERTGVHARVSIFGQRENLSWSYLNIERREDRSSLAGAAFSTLKTEVTYTKADMVRDLDSFCAGLWEFHLSRFVPEEMTGDETPAPMVFLLRPYVIQGGGTIIFAAPGRGKSYTALLWAVSIDAGCSKFWPVTQRRVLFINLERSAESLRRRLSFVNKVLALPTTRPLLALNARGKSLSDVMAGCRKAVRKHDVGLIVLDSISRAGVGDLNENQPGNKVIDALSSLSPSWLALGHTSRASDAHLYGSVMQDAGADVCIQLSAEVKDDGTLGLGYQVTKQNDIGIHGQKIYALEFSQDGLTGFRSAKVMEFPQVEGSSRPGMLTTIKEWILNRETADATSTEVATEFRYDQGNISRLFTQSGEFVQTRKVKHSVYYGVKGKEVSM